MHIRSFYSSVKRLAERLDEKLAIRILCLFIRLCRAYGAHLDSLAYPRLRLRVARLQHGLTSRRA
jgi:hypothetical protein